MNSNHSKSNILIKFEKYCYCKLNKNYNVTSITLNKLIISNIIYNNRLHIVSCFKEFLIFLPLLDSSIPSKNLEYSCSLVSLFNGAILSKLYIFKLCKDIPFILPPVK